jgi:hypothetical protein
MGNFYQVRRTWSRNAKFFFFFFFYFFFFFFFFPLQSEHKKFSPWPIPAIPAIPDNFSNSASGTPMF